ncbi:hypothetical protein REPUB_Repub01dG0058700 [Reevesia pubescens]
MAALKALEFALELGFMRIILEGDSLTVIKKLQNKSVDLSLIGVLIEDAKALISIFTICLFSHARKYCNTVAHTLAKNGLGIGDEHHWIGETPALVESIVLSETIDHLIQISALFFFIYI